MGEKVKKLEDTTEHQALRNALVKEISRKGIVSPEVTAALAKIPRHFFVSDDTSTIDAYADKALSIGQQQTISQPYTVAYQTQLLDIQTGYKILEIGTGSGYQAAVLLQWPVELYTIEYNKILYKRTQQLMERLNYLAHMFHGDGSQGLPTYAPFDRILVTAGAPEVPDTLLTQLKVGGKMVIPVGPPKRQKMLRITRAYLQQFDTEIFDMFSFVPLLGKYGWK
jgi:protein-L-isoaspartate(D-aspartate) O-methyltransferase